MFGLSLLVNFFLENQERNKSGDFTVKYKASPPTIRQIGKDKVTTVNHRSTMR